MRATVGDFLNLVDAAAPFELSEGWDNSGLQAGDLSWETDRVLVGLDVTVSLLEEAHLLGAGLVVTHHPLMIQPEKSIDFSTLPGSVILLSACNKISVISAHTNLDKAPAGLNDLFAEKLGFTNFVPLLPEPAPSVDKKAGLGRVGRLESEMTLKSLITRVKQILSLDRVRVTGDPDQRVATAAVCTGSGGSLIDHVLASGAQVYITGDVKYHEARKLEDGGVGLIDVGHFASEYIAIDLLVDRLKHLCREQGLEVEIMGFYKEKDPFTIF